MNIILLDILNDWEELLPLTFTRPVSELRIGILTIKEKWEKYLKTSISYLTKDYLQEKFPLIETTDNLLINSTFLPNKKLILEIKKLENNTALLSENNKIIAVRTDKINNYVNYKNNKKTKSTIFCIETLTDIFSLNKKEIASDFELITNGRKSAKLNNSNTIINEKNIFVEKTAVVNNASLNASCGFIYIGENAEIMEGSLIRGSLALCDNSTIKMGAKIYGDTTIGPHSKVGGEINNSVIIGYTNKAHDGFLGNSVIGEWCNLGADTNNSNLKNNYSSVEIWNYKEKKYKDTNLQFCGLIMADHSKCGINTMFNTGTVVGVNVNIIGAEFTKKHIPSFTWVMNGKFYKYKLDKALEVAEKVMARRNLKLNEIERKILNVIFNLHNS